jgi:hypothetical protein
METSRPKQPPRVTDDYRLQASALKLLSQIEEAVQVARML